MKKTILIVDGNYINQITYQKFLSSLCHEIILANNSLEALEILKSRKIELFIINVRIPGINGLELARHIRNPNDLNQFKYCHKTAPIIILSSDLPINSPDINDCLIIPVNKQLLVDKVNEHLSTKNSAD